MHPLTITYAPFVYSDIGLQNHRNFVNAGFTNLTCFPNGALHRKLARVGFEAVGDNFLPFIYGQVFFAFHIAVQFDIKLIFYGENGEAEYGGNPKTADLPGMPLDYFAEAYFKGATVDDCIAWGEQHGIITPDDYTQSDLTFYKPPPLELIKQRQVEFHWFSYYHKWIPQENFYYSSEHTGFEANPAGRSEGTYSKYASLDDRTDGFHFYLGFIKFGLGRASSDAAHEIRDGHLTREEGVALVHRYDGEFPARHFAEFLEYINITEERFWEVVDRYRLPHLWEKKNGEWRLKKPVS